MTTDGRMVQVKLDKVVGRGRLGGGALYDREGEGYSHTQGWCVGTCLSHGCHGLWEGHADSVVSVRHVGGGARGRRDGRLDERKGGAAVTWFQYMSTFVNSQHTDIKQIQRYMYM